MSTPILDPSLPADHSALVSGELRGQFQAIQYSFDDAIKEARASVGAKNFDNARTALERARVARNIDPGSTAGLPGLVLPAGMTSGGLPVALEFDGPAGSDRALDGAILTRPEARDPALLAKLSAIAGRVLGA